MEFDEQTQDEWDWNLWWRSSRFRTSDYDGLQSWQRINHYPRSSHITKKDGLARNLKRMRAVYGSSVYNFSPVAFNLPNDYTRFVNEYTKQKEKQRQNSGRGDLLWICKPADMSRGRGIFVFKDLSQLTYDCTAVVQRYISRPLLIGGYKFDLRLYVAVPSFHPLRIYVHEEGLVRFSTDKYNLGTLDNLFSHLTNTSINKHSPMYGADKEGIGLGCKWTLTQLRHHFRQENLDDYPIWMKIINIITLTMITQHSQIPPSNNCYELFGYDIIIDAKYKPWLLEVNFSPAMTCDSQVDVHVKKPMMHDLCDMLGFTRVDLDRGGKQHQVNMRKKSRSFDTDLFRYGRRNLNKHKKLPRIKQRQGGDAGDSAESSDNESAGDFNRAPLMAGCGLPLVRHGRERLKQGSGFSVVEPNWSSFNDWREKRPLGPIVQGPASKQKKGVDRHRDFDVTFSDPETYNKRTAQRRSKLAASKEDLDTRESGSNEITASSLLTYSGNSIANRVADCTKLSVSLENIPSEDVGLGASELSKRSVDDFTTARKASVPQYVPPNRHSFGSRYRQPYINPAPKTRPEFRVKYGGFHLVFPLNDVTHRCAEAQTLDLRTVVSECNQALQETLENNGKKRFTPLWAPLNSNV